jgi:hypothetical protein
MADLTLSPDFEPIAQKIADLFENRKALNRLGLMAERMIQSRTRKGIDVHGRRFRNYSDQHAEKREAEGLETNTVNLEFSVYDGMLKQIGYLFRDEATVELYFLNERSERLATYHNVDGAGKGKIIREFWNLSEEELQTLANDYNGWIAAELQKLESTVK